ncbi:hypothetical protein GQ53DRAFT_849863 [Thozetella sp. PMI_491]|nr:hypothetical protein GQ53DRAFT_849863 [Thozetella sp. PMI_491]
MSSSSNLTSEAHCPGFEGNPDLYGLGIRIGVYLQWYSTWLCITIDSEASAEIHTANSVFIFAIMVALLQAISNQVVNVVEAYLMLQICWGYLLTLMPIFGLRLHLLSPRRVEKIKAAFFNSHSNGPKRPKRDRVPPFLRNIDVENAVSAGLLPGVFRVFSNLGGPAFTVRLSELSAFKDVSLSWMGAAWRMSIATMVAITNTVLLFGSMYPPLRTDGLCGTDGFIFMFGKRDLGGSCLTFLQVVGVMITVGFGLVASILVTTFERLFLYFEALAICDLVWLLGKKIFGKRHPRSPSKPPTKHSRSRKVVQKLAVALRSGSGIFPLAISIASPTMYLFLVVLGTVFDAMESMEGTNQPYVPGQLFSLYALFSSGTRLADANEKTDKESDKLDKLSTSSWTVASLWQLWVVGATIWFIASVELSIRWNNISGVHTIESTGQLIPFVIGVVSFTRAKHKLLVFIIKKHFPDWHKLDVKITFVSTTPVKFEVVRKDGEMKSLVPRPHISTLPGTCMI